jgi:flagellar biosynthesis/type III secretory pathway M-ring protein FliF/YscJ
MSLVAALIVLACSALSDAQSLFFEPSDDLIGTNPLNDSSATRSIGTTATQSQTATRLQTDTPDATYPPEQSPASGTTLFVIAIVILVAIVLAAIIVCTCRRRRRRKAIAHLNQLDEQVDNPLLVPPEFF